MNTLSIKLKDLIIVLVSVLCSTIGQLLLKYGMNLIGYIRLDRYVFLSLCKVLTNRYVLIGLFMYALSAMMWMIVLSRIKLSIAYPMVSLSYVMTICLSLFILKETIPLTRWLGIIIILIGIYFIVSK